MNNWIETGESYVVVLYLSSFHDGVAIDIRA